MTRMLGGFAALMVASVPVVAQVVGRGVTGGIAAGAFTQQASRDNQQPQTGTSRIRGRVTITSTNQPLRRASVRLIAQQSGARTTTTDTDGRFEFGDLPAGRYSVTASKTGYIAIPGKTLDIGDAQRIDDVNISVARGGVITGQVVDEFGDPVIGANVVTMRSQYTQGRRQFVASGNSSQTNDIGEFRLFGLNAGQYYVAVTLPNIGQVIGGPIAPGPRDTTGYAPTYYPGTSDVASAERLNVAAGQILPNINVSLTATRLATITGTVLDAQGRPMATADAQGRPGVRGSVTAMPRGGILGLQNNGGPIRADGTFVLSNVPPGEYTLRAMIPPPAPPAPGVQPTPPQVAIAYVTVNGDVSGVALYPVKPVVVTGRLVFDDAAAAASIRASMIRVIAQPINPQDTIPLPGNPAAVVKDDLTFELTTSPGIVTIRAIVPAPPGSGGAAWQIKALWVGGLNVVDIGVTLRPGDDLSGVEIELTDRAQQVSGTVTDADAQAAPERWVVLFSQDRDKWTNASGRYVATVMTGPAGRFRVLSLPAGNYYAAVVDQADRAAIGPLVGTGMFNDPEFLETAVRGASKFSLSEGAAVTVDLKLPAR